MKNKFLMLGGLLAPVVYAATVILGGSLRPDYSHMAQPVSDLIASGTPNKALLDALFGIYNLRRSRLRGGCCNTRAPIPNSAPRRPAGWARSPWRPRACSGL